MRTSGLFFGFVMLMTVFEILFPINVGAVNLGVYFDSNAMSNCLPEVTTFPYFATGYIIATDCASAGGIIGWEAKVSWDNTLVVTSGGVSGQSINIKTFPEFMVGLGSPLSGNSSVVLANLSIVAVDSGGIYLNGLGISAPDSMPAILFEGDLDPTPALLPYGGYGKAVATIGSLSCPEIAIAESQLVQEAPAPTGELVYYSSASPSGGYGAKSGVAFINPKAELAFRGAVTHVEKECLSIQSNIREANGVLGALVLDVDVSEVIFGIVPNQIRIHVLGYDYPGFMRYAEDWGVPPETEVIPGVECLVGAMNYEGTFLVGTRGSFVLMDPGKMASFDEISRGLRDYSPQSQFIRSDLVVDAEFISSDNRVLTFDVIRIIKGDANISQRVQVKWTRGMRAWSKWEGRGYVARLYLKSWDTFYRPLHGRHSISLLGVAK